jgi:hypothetical protein
MSWPNFFKRKSLLPGSLTAARPRGASKTDEPSSSDNPEVFTRPTVIPAVPLDEQAAAAMRSLGESDVANTAPAPRLESASPPDIEHIETRLGPVEWASVTHRGELFSGNESAQAIPPPARGPGAALWHAGRETTGRTFSDLAMDATGGALDFVDGLPRSTHRPTAGSDGEIDSEREEDFDLSSHPVSISDLYAVGDFSGALAAAEAVLAQRPDDEMARRYAEDCTRVLLKMCEARIGPFNQRPTLAMGHEQVRWLALDHREGFLLSLIDGASSVDDLLDISGMPRLEALRIFAALIDKAVIRMR